MNVVSCPVQRINNPAIRLILINGRTFFRNKPGWQYKQTAEYLLKQLYGVVGGIRMNGSAASALCYVAAGRFDAWAEAFIGKWDYSAAALIVLEAGGKVTDFFGSEYFIEGHHIMRRMALYILSFNGC